MQLQELKVRQLKAKIFFFCIYFNNAEVQNLSVSIKECIFMYQRWRTIVYFYITMVTTPPDVHLIAVGNLAL